MYKNTFLNESQTSSVVHFFIPKYRDKNSPILNIVPFLFLGTIFYIRDVQYPGTYNI